MLLKDPQGKTLADRKLRGKIRELISLDGKIIKIIGLTYIPKGDCSNDFNS